MDEKGIKNFLKYAFQVNSLDELVQERNNKLKFLVNQNTNLISESRELQNKIKQLKNIYKKNQSEEDSLDYIIKSKSTYLDTLENSIDNLTNGEDYQKILEITQQKVTSILNSKEDLLMASIVTTLYVLRNNPDKTRLIIDLEDYDSETSITNNSGNFLNDLSFKKYIKTHYEPILDIANSLYEKILNVVQDDVLFSSPKIE
jgi:hypothetical protein